MSTLDRQLNRLRTSLRSVDGAAPDSFSKVFDAFLDLVGGTDLMGRCQPLEDAGICALIQRLAQVHAGEGGAAVMGTRLLQYAAAGLVHGGFIVGRDPGSFFFFTQEQQGLVAICRGSVTHYYRITAAALPRSTVLMRAGVDSSSRP